MILTSQTVVKFSNEYYPLFDEFCFKAKNLYNVALYSIRQAYFKNEAPLSYNSLDKILKQEQNIDYANMPLASSAQWTLHGVFKNWKSFWESIKAYTKSPDKFIGKPQMPKYMHKTKGRSILYLTNQNVKCSNINVKNMD